MSSAPKLILSSSSKARRALLKRLLIPFSVTSPDVDETPLPGEQPKTMVKRLAQTKAKEVAAQYHNAFIIGCDQVGVFKDTILCKPLTHKKAKEQLQLVSGKCVRFLTGMCLFDANTQTAQTSVEIYDVYFRHLSPTMIEDYLLKEKPYHCAGSFQAEGLGIALIEKFSGEDYTALIGLPLIRLTEMLEKVGLSPIAK